MKISNDYEEIYNKIVFNSCLYLWKANPKIKSLILGISGGIDSAIVAVIMKEVTKKMWKRDIKLYGYSLPFSTNKEDEMVRARRIGYTCCDNFVEESIPDTGIRFDKFSYPPSKKEKIRLGNIVARLRMIYLYDRANKHNGLVLSTDNLTEYNLGFWTLHGDVGDFGPIQQLWKSEVYGLAQWIVDNRIGGYGSLNLCIDAKPTDGLGISDSDLDQILPGWSGSYIDGYRKVDEFLIDHLYNGVGFESDNPVINRHLGTRFKRDNPYIIQREKLVK